MTDRSIRHLLVLAGAALIALAAAPSFAADGETAYRCAVLGDSNACTTSADPKAGEDAFARYQRYLGNAGPTDGTPAPAVDGFSAYQRVIGGRAS